MNLCSNAIQAMSTGGAMARGRLEAADVAARARALARGRLRPGRYVRPERPRAAVSGMDRGDAFSRIFEPFFTTKDIGPGHRSRPVAGLRDRHRLGRCDRT